MARDTESRIETLTLMAHNASGQQRANYLAEIDRLTALGEAPDLSEDDLGLIKFALFYTYEMLTDAISDGDGGITIADRLDELRLLDHKLHFLDAIDFGEPTDG